ncbi:MAG: hypothetical protein ACP5IT_12420 [Thermoproteota archaeon]
MSEWKWIDEDEVVVPVEAYICKKDGKLKLPEECKKCLFFKGFTWFRGRYVAVCGWKHGQS